MTWTFIPQKSLRKLHYFHFLSGKCSYCPLIPLCNFFWPTYFVDRPRSVKKVALTTTQGFDDEHLLDSNSELKGEAELNRTSSIFILWRHSQIVYYHMDIPCDGPLSHRQVLYNIQIMINFSLFSQIWGVYSTSCTISREWKEAMGMTSHTRIRSLTSHYALILTVCTMYTAVCLLPLSTFKFDINYWMRFIQ